MSFDPMDNGWRKHLTSGGVGYTTENVYSFNGNTEGKTAIPVDGGQFVKISDDTPDLSEIVAVEAIQDGTAITLSKEELLYEQGESYQALYVGNIILVVSGSAITESGLFFGMINESTYLKSVTFPETVHTIEPKYIPNCIPMVELTTELKETENAQFSAEESAKLTEAYETGLPVCLKMKADGYQTSCVAMRIEEGDGVLAGYVAGGMYVLMRGESSWVGAVGG